MPSGIYIRTQECNRKHSEAEKGKHYSPETEFKKGDNLGKHPKMEFQIGHKVSEVTKRKIGLSNSEAQKGNKNNWKGGAKLSNIRSRAKRREFDFIPMNEYQEDYVFHHWNKDYGSYMPEELHHSVYHNQHTGQGMNEMNALAMNYL